jgi:hypothetical protein
MAALPDGRIIVGLGVVSGAENRNGMILVLDPASLDTPLVELGRHEPWVEAIAVLPDSRVVTVGDDGRVLLWMRRAACIKLCSRAG